MSTLPLQNLMLVSVFYQLLLFIGDPIFLGVFKLGYEFLDLSVLGAIFFGHCADSYLILDDRHELLVELMMGQVEIIF